GVKRPRHVRGEMKILDEAQARQLLDVARARQRWYALIALALGSGMRQGELLALEWRDVDFDKGTVSGRRSVSFPKGRPVIKEPKSEAGRRPITLPPFVVAALADHRKRMLARGHIDRTVFCTRSGAILYSQNLRRQIYWPLLKAAGLARIRFHDLRHTHASA